MTLEPGRMSAESPLRSRDGIGARTGGGGVIPAIQVLRAKLLISAIMQNINFHAHRQYLL